MSFFGKLFGSDKALEKTIDVVSSGLGKLVYTKEEKAEAAAAELSEARQMVVAWMAATQGQNLARRLIALSITGVWLLDIVFAQLSGAIAVFSDHSKEFQQLAEFMQSSASDMSSAVMLILAFYFAAPHMGDFAKAIVGRFTQSVNKG